MSRVAAIDCGTNSIRLLIADIGPDGRLTDVTRLMRVQTSKASFWIGRSGASTSGSPVSTRVRAWRSESASPKRRWMSP